MKQLSFDARLTELPVWERRADAIEGHVFNHARLALKRLGNPSRLSLEGLRGLDLVIEDQIWVCVDRALQDRPVLAWSAFTHAGRLALHAPIRCELRIYHTHASVIRARILEIMERTIVERLATGYDADRRRTPATRAVVHFR